MLNKKRSKKINGRVNERERERESVCVCVCVWVITDMPRVHVSLFLSLFLFLRTEHTTQSQHSHPLPHALSVYSTHRYTIPTQVTHTTTATTTTTTTTIERTPPPPSTKWWVGSYLSTVFILGCWQNKPGQSNIRVDGQGVWRWCVAQFQTLDVDMLIRRPFSSSDRPIV